MNFKCAHCGKTADKSPGEVNRARNSGANLYCGRRCMGLARRIGKTKAQKVAEKRIYDQAYRAKNLETIKAKKREYFKRTYDPVKAAVERKKRAKAHVEYCRRPEYKHWKSAYDRRHRAEKFFGPFAEAAMVFNDLRRDINERITNHESRKANGTINKIIARRRDAQAQERGRPRSRDRRRDHSSPLGA